MATLFTAADYRPSTNKARTEIANQAAELVKGEGFARIGGNKPLSNPDKIMDRGLRVAKALRKNAETAKVQAPDLWKSMAPSFMSEFLHAYQLQPQNQAYNQLAAAIQGLAADMGKTVALTAPLATGLVPYDLTSPSHSARAYTE